MNCLSCGSGAGFQRLIVRTDSLEREGNVCSSCEWKLNQLFLNDHDDEDQGETCLKCSKTGTFALPEMELSVDVEVNGNKIIYDYEIDETTPRLCSDHLEFFLTSPRQADPLNMLDDPI